MAEYKLKFTVTQTFAVGADRDTAYTDIKATIDGVSGTPTVIGRAQKWDEDVENVEQTVVQNSVTENL